METETVTRAVPIWASFGLVLLIVLSAVAAATIKDALLVKAAATVKSQ